MHQIMMSSSLLHCLQDAPRDVVATRNPPTVKEGQTATLICSAKGNPAPTFTWFKNDNVLPNQEFQLVMTGLTTEHDGWYSCEARNTHGSQKSQEVSVKITCGYCGCRFGFNAFEKKGRKRKKGSITWLH